MLSMSPLVALGVSSRLLLPLVVQAGLWCRSIGSLALLRGGIGLAITRELDMGFASRRLVRIYMYRVKIRRQSEAWLWGGSSAKQASSLHKRSRSNKNNSYE